MFLSKFWTLILVIIVAMLLSVIYLVPSSINESRVGNVRALIVKDRLQMESILKMEARSRLDTTIVFAVDQVVREQLFEALKRKDPTQVPMETKEKLLSQMRKLNDGLTTFKADILIAVDRDGIVIGQVGENERSSGYSLRGFPLVQAALRGYLMDDSWFFDGKLYRMSARPVIHSGMYVGAIIHGQKMSKDFADVLSRASDSQVGIYVEDHIVAVATPGIAADEAAEKGQEKEKDKKKAAAPEAAGVFATDAQINTILVDDVFKDKEYMASGRSSVILSKGKYYVVAIKMVGEARKNNAGIVLIRQVPKVGGVMAFVKSIKKTELAAVPWWQIGSLTFGLLFIGVLLIYLEGDRPKSRFLREVEKMVSKEGERLNIYLFRGKYRKLADAINRAIDKAVQVLVSKATSEAPSVAKILSGVSVDNRLSKPAFEVPGQISLDDIPPPPPADDKAKGRKPRTPTVPSIGGAVPVPMQPPAPKPAPAPAPAAPMPRPAAQAPAAPQKPPAASVPIPMQPAPLPPPKPMPQAAKPQPSAAVKPADAKAGISAWGGGLDEEETRIYEGEKGGPLPAIPADRVPPVQPAPPRPAAGMPAAVDGDEELFRRIYEEFYKTKVACGENVDNLTFDRFKATLRKQEEAIRERTRCKKVEFRVYVKDGKAALKASPIK